MITILEAIKLSTDYLEKKNVESPRANAEILLAEVLNCKRLELYLSFDKPISENELSNYREFHKKKRNENSASIHNWLCRILRIKNNCKSECAYSKT